MSETLPPELFGRIDESDDAAFYGPPRLVTHIDDTTIEALTQVYRELLPPGGRVLDLMSSWVSHLPPDVRFENVAVLGMNRAELEANPRADEHVVHDLNREPELPYPDDHFDAVMNAVSIQYLVKPVEVLRSVRRVLRPGGVHVIATSHRCFPDKAIAAFRGLPAPDRLRLICAYFELAGGWTAPKILDRSPVGADPLWVVVSQTEA